MKIGFPDSNFTPFQSRLLPPDKSSLNVLWVCRSFGQNPTGKEASQLPKRKWSKTLLIYLRLRSFQEYRTFSAKTGKFPSKSGWVSNPEKEVSIIIQRSSKLLPHTRPTLPVNWRSKHKHNEITEPHHRQLPTSYNCLAAIIEFPKQKLNPQNPIYIVYYNLEPYCCYQSQGV